MSMRSWSTVSPSPVAPSTSTKRTAVEVIERPSTRSTGFAPDQGRRIGPEVTGAANRPPWQRRRGERTLDITAGASGASRRQEDVMAKDGPFGFDPDEFDRVVRE